VKSIRKKWKAKQFAAGVDRELVERGTAMLGVELNDLMQEVVLAMREVSDELGL